VIALSACKSAPKATTPTDDGAVRAAVEQVIAAQYKAVERGDLDAWGAPFDNNVFLFGSDPTEAFAGRDELLAQMKKNAAGRMKSDVTRTYRSTRLAIGVAPDRRAAWAADEIEGEFQPRTWRAFWMTAVDGKDAQSASAMLGLSPGAVYVAKSRVLARLRQKVRELQAN